jgi:hypothetical protein
MSRIEVLAQEVIATAAIDYYDELNRAQRGSGDVTEWVACDGLGGGGATLDVLLRRTMLLGPLLDLRDRAGIFSLQQFAHRFLGLDTLLGDGVRDLRRIVRSAPDLRGRARSRWFELRGQAA